ncbi:CBS domain-containing protein [Sphingomonas bacterium]|uniref:CBS domain-containing protein n=1 Tax=Sphingomonas bacterium TaxID=1895847 RepID=UPI00157634EA|nr:CBS domain-containing protein [Sphingomonas bacterium]
MTIAAILRAKGGDVIHVTADTTVRTLAALLTEKRIGAVPVLDGEQIVGILSERDIVQALAREGGAVLDWPVARVMTATPITVAADTPLLAGLSLMTRRRIRHLPVVEGGRMIGIVSIGDLVKARIDRIEAEAEALRAYIAG